MIHWTSYTGMQIDYLWPLVRNRLSQGFVRPESVDAYFEGCKKNEAQLWGVQDGNELIAAFITEIVTIGDRKVCNIVAASGTRVHEWKHFISVLEAWATEAGCDGMRLANCRQGWRRVLRDYDTTKTHQATKRIVLEKELTNGRRNRNTDADARNGAMEAATAVSDTGDVGCPKDLPVGQPVILRQKHRRGSKRSN